MDSHADDGCAERTAKIRAANDRLRTTGQGGKIYMTAAVAAQPPQLIAALLQAIGQFDAFTSNNDPWNEHDFGSVVVNDETVFWKIDCYDLALEWGSPDPADEAVTRRVMTLMTGMDL